MSQLHDDNTATDSTNYLHLHVRHVLRLRQGHAGFDLEARLVREEVVVAGVGRRAEGKCRWTLGYKVSGERDAKSQRTINQVAGSSSGSHLSQSAPSRT
jgi:hypothetical protein